MAETPRRRAADDLSRKRRGTYRAPETGRVHHLGQAPAQQPVYDEHGAVSFTEAAAVRLQRLMPAQLEALAADLRARMATAAAELEFEAAGRARDELAEVEVELSRRH